VRATVTSVSRDADVCDLERGGGRLQQPRDLHSGPFSTRVPQEMPRSFEARCNRPQRLTARLLNGGREIHCVTRPFLYGSPTGCSCLSRQARPWSTDASKIEPGQGGGRLMGLDGHPAPPIPGRPMLRKPRRVPPRWGFPFWVRGRNCAVESGAYRRRRPPAFNRAAMTRYR
jgi:hypothetical protein